MSWWRRRWCKHLWCGHPLEYIRNDGPWAGIVCLRCGKLIVEGVSAKEVIEEIEKRAEVAREFVKLMKACEDAAP